MRYVLQIHFTCTNNVAEYESLLHGLRLAKEMGISRINCFGDSDLVVSQVDGRFDATDPNMAAYKRAVDQLSGHFAGYELHHIDRRKNEEADMLSRIGSKREMPPAGVFLNHIYNPSIKPPKEIDLAVPDAPDSVLVLAAHTVPEWTEPYMEYVLYQKLPSNEVAA